MTSEEEIAAQFIGTHEVLEDLEGQGETGVDLDTIKCNKSHAGYIPVNKLSVEHFPPGYHDNDLCDLTKAIANLTVRIAVKFTYKKRPEFIPGTKNPYPCFNTRGQNSLHTGTGWVWGVNNYTDSKPCPCPECERSGTPKNEWWEVVVLTASHVIYHASEAEKSFCRLWFDDVKLPVIRIWGYKIDSSVTNMDWCELFCATHDLGLGDKLEQMVAEFKDLDEKVKDKYKSRGDADKLTIIVSHPHGLCKKVSIDDWVHRHVQGDWTRYTYTASTCTGSSGAMVYRLGCGVSTHPHSGTNSSGLNYSGLYRG